MNIHILLPQKEFFLEKSPGAVSIMVSDQLKFSKFKKKIKNISEIHFVIHCFTGNSNFCHKLLDLGCYISFSGIITFNKVEEICKAVEIVPLDKLLVETDSPYLSPVPFRGKNNSPSNVKFVAEKIAQIKKVSFEEIALCTSKNFNKIFSIK